MKKNRKIHLSISGFSIIEVLVAIGLLSVVSLALLAVLDSTNKGQKRAMNRDNILNLTNQIRSTFVDANLCRQAFVFNIGNSVNFPAPPAPATNYALNRVTAFGRDLVLTNAPVPGTMDVRTPPTSAATGLRLQLGASSPSATPGFTNWDATLVVPLVATNQAAMKDISIIFLITTDNGNPSVIASCNAMASGTTEQSVCENIMGGIFNLAQVPQCRLQQTLVSGLKFRDQLSAIPGGSFLAVETTAGSRGIAAFGAGARVGLYPTEADFTTTPNNGVGLTIPANNQLQIDASQGIINDGYLHITRGAMGPAFALKLTNSVSGLDVFNLDRDGRLSVNTTQTSAWNNFGASSAATDIARFYDNAGTSRMTIDDSGNLALGPSAGGSKLDVRADAAGSVLSWGLAAGVTGVLSAAPGAASISTSAGTVLNIAATSNLNLLGGAVVNMVSTGDFRVITNGGANNLIFTATDATFSTNVNAPVFTPSDIRLKTDISEISNVLETLLQVQGYTYVLKDDKLRKKHFGFIAQELQKTFPNLVQVMSNGYKSVNYVEVIPLLVEALKESEQKNRALELRIEKMESSLKNIETLLKKLKN